MRLYVYILVLLSIFAHANNAELEQILNENSETVVESGQSQDTIDDLQLTLKSLNYSNKEIKSISPILIREAEFLYKKEKI